MAHKFNTLDEVRAEWYHFSQLYEEMCEPFDEVEVDNTARQAELREYIDDLETIIKEWK